MMNRLMNTRWTLDFLPLFGKWARAPLTNSQGPTSFLGSTPLSRERGCTRTGRDATVISRMRSKFLGGGAWARFPNSGWKSSLHWSGSLTLRSRNVALQTTTIGLAATEKHNLCKLALLILAKNLWRPSIFCMCPKVMELPSLPY